MCCLDEIRPAVEEDCYVHNPRVWVVVECLCVGSGREMYVCSVGVEYW